MTSAAAITAAVTLTGVAWRLMLPLLALLPEGAAAACVAPPCCSSLLLLSSTCIAVAHSRAVAHCSAAVGAFKGAGGVPMAGAGFDDEAAGVGRRQVRGWMGRSSSRSGASKGYEVYRGEQVSGR